MSPPNWRVSISSVDESFNEIISVGHLNFENVTFFHSIDQATQFSGAHVIQSTSVCICLWTITVQTTRCSACRWSIPNQAYRTSPLSIWRRAKSSAIALSSKTHDRSTPLSYSSRLDSTSACRPTGRCRPFLSASFAHLQRSIQKWWRILIWIGKRTHQSNTQLLQRHWA